MRTTIYEDGIDQPRSMDRADISDVNGNSNTSEVLRFHYHQNALSSTSEMSQPSGAVVEWVTYDVYGLPTLREKGGTVVAQSSVGNPYLFTGREYDQESGKYFYRARTYDPVAGRFLQRDPAGFVDGLSLYEYTRSSPSTGVDPLGMDTRDPEVQRLLDARAALYTAFKALKAAADALSKAKKATAAAQAAYDAAKRKWESACKKKPKDRNGGAYVRGKDPELDALKDALDAAEKALEKAQLAEKGAQATHDLQAKKHAAALREVQAARDALKSGMKKGDRGPSREDILEMVRQDILAFGEDATGMGWLDDILGNARLRRDPDPRADGDAADATWGYLNGVHIITVRDSVIDTNSKPYEWFGALQNLAELLIHEARHGAEHVDPKAPDGKHPVWKKGGVTKAGQAGWQEADRIQALKIKNAVKAAHGVK